MAELRDSGEELVTPFLVIGDDASGGTPSDGIFIPYPIDRW